LTYPNGLAIASIAISNRDFTAGFPILILGKLDRFIFKKNRLGSVEWVRAISFASVSLPSLRGNDDTLAAFE